LGSVTGTAILGGPNMPHESQYTAMLVSLGQHQEGTK